MIDDPSRSTVVAWYQTLPAALALLVERVQAGFGRLLGDTFTPRDPAQVHATLIGLERAPAPFDPAPLAAHLREALSPPWTIRFGGFAPDDRRWLSRGLPMHERMVGVYGSKVVLIGWPMVGGEPRRTLAELRLRCADFGAIHSYGDDPDVYLVLGEVTGAPTADVVSAIRHELATAPIHVPLSVADLALATYDDTTLPRASTTWCPL